jgi:hypothetical protein
MTHRDPRWRVIQLRTNREHNPRWRVVQLRTNREHNPRWRVRSTLPVGVAEGTIGIDAIAEALLELLRLGKATFDGAGEERLTVDLDLEYASRTGPQRDLPENVGEGRQELLREPRGSEEETALGAVGDGYSGGRHRAALDASAIEANRSST